MGRRANAHNAHNAINALQSGGVVVVVGRRKLNIEFVECGVRNGFPKTCRRWFGSLAPAHSALAGLWLRPDPFRHLPGGSSPFVERCAVAQSVGLRNWPGSGAHPDKSGRLTLRRRDCTKVTIVPVISTRIFGQAARAMAGQGREITKVTLVSEVSIEILGKSRVRRPAAFVRLPSLRCFNATRRRARGEAEGQNVLVIRRIIDRFRRM